MPSRTAAEALTTWSPPLSAPSTRTPRGLARAAALSSPQIEAFSAVLNRLSDDELQAVERASEPAAAAATVAAMHWDFEAPAHAAREALGQGAGDDMRRGLVASWALGMPMRMAALSLPASVMALYPAATDRLAGYLTANDGPYDPDHWAKDVRFALGLSVPGAESQVIDMHARLGRGDVLRHALSGRGVDVLARYAAARAWGPWLEVHTEARHLADFNEAGWNSCWERAADIVRERPRLRGMIGSSWFYDPPLTEISPRLAHLRANPIKGGAFMVHQGPGEIHTQRAATASASRKALIDSGEYTARCWLVVWPRKALLRWADAYLADG